MNYLQEHWFAIALIGVALALGLLLIMRGSPALLVVSAALALCGAGGLLLPPEIGKWISISALGGFLILILVLIWTSAWSPGVAWSLAGAGVLGLGGLV